MNKRRQFTEEFKQEAAAQVIERGYPNQHAHNAMSG